MRDVLIVFAGLMVILVAIAITLWRLDSAERRERRDAGAGFCKVTPIEPKRSQGSLCATLQEAPF